MSSSDSDNHAWAQLLAAILAGWNIGLVVAFFVVLALSETSAALDAPIYAGSAGFFIVVALAIGFAVFIGRFGGRKLLGFFRSLGPLGSYACLVGFVLLTLISFPTPFSFMIIQ